MDLRLLDAPAVEWHVIVPTGQQASPFELANQGLYLEGRRIADARLVEHDDAQLGYARNSGRVVTMNTNARSACTGCVFCPNTMADANDPAIASSDAEIQQWISVFIRKYRWQDLSGVDEINLSTGCFGAEQRAVEHLLRLRVLLGQFGFRGRLGILSSVIRTDDGLRALRDAQPFALFLTLECLTRRALLLKESKADLTPSDAVEVLQRARTFGHHTGVMLVVGLDPLDALVEWLRDAAPYLTDFPNLQIYQSHGPYMDVFRTPGAHDLVFFVEARRRLESILEPTSLRPRAWQNYRPLWYYEFAGEALRPQVYAEEAQ